MTKNEILKVFFELEDEKELIYEQILQAEKMLKLFPVASDYINGKIDAFKILESYIVNRLEELTNLK